MTAPTDTQGLIIAALQAKVELLELEQRQTSDLLREKIPDEAVITLVNRMQADAQAAQALYLSKLEVLLAGMLAVASSALTDGSVEVFRHSMESIEVTLKTLTK